MNKFIPKLFLLFLLLLCFVILQSCERLKKPVPESPTGVSATTGNTQATVIFTALVNNGGSVITGYTVTMRTSP